MKEIKLINFNPEKNWIIWKNNNVEENKKILWTSQSLTLVLTHHSSQWSFRIRCLKFFTLTDVPLLLTQNTLSNVFPHCLFRELILSVSTNLDIYFIFARRFWPTFLKAHLTIPYASLNHLYQTSCRIRLWFTLFCFSFFTMCLCIFTQFALFFLPNCRFEISTIAEQLCYCWCLTKQGSENKPILQILVTPAHYTTSLLPQNEEDSKNFTEAFLFKLKTFWYKWTTGRNKLPNNLQIFLGKTICLIMRHLKIKSYPMKEIEKNNLTTTTFTYFHLNTKNLFILV